MPRPEDGYEDDDRPSRRRRPRDDDDEDDDDYDDRPRRRADDVDPVAFIVPTDVSVWSILACYLGLIGCVVHPLALVAIVCGVVALRKRKKATNYGRVTSDIRAVIGIVLGGLTLLGYLIVGVLAATGVLK